MAENGTVRFEAGGQPYALRFDINAFCRIEAELGIESVAEFQAVLKERLSFTKLRKLFACGLSPAASDEQAGTIMSELGIDRASEMLTECIQAAFPNSNPGKGADEGKADPVEPPSP